MNSVKAGNEILDGEVVAEKWKMALEIKSGHDDNIRGLGLHTEAFSHCPTRLKA